MGRLNSGDVSGARKAVKDGQDRRKAAKAAKKHVSAALGNMQKRLEAGVQLGDSVGAGLSMMQGKKATYAAEKRAAKKAKVEEDDDEEMEEEEEEEESEEEKKEITNNLLQPLTQEADAAAGTLFRRTDNLETRPTLSWDHCS